MLEVTQEAQKQVAAHMEGRDDVMPIRVFLNTGG